MSSVRLRRLSAVAAAATAVLALSGCSPIGENAQTNKQYDAGVGFNVRGPHVQVLNSLFVDNGDKTATYSASLLNRDATSHLLKGVEVVASDGSAIASTLTAPHELATDLPFRPGTNGDIILTGPFNTGGVVKITLTFDNAAPVTVDAPVVTRTSIYDSVAAKAGVPALSTGGQTPATTATTAP